MLHDPARHERLQPIAWDEHRVRATINHIVRDTEQHFSPERYWPLHPRDVEGDEDPNQIVGNLYYGACGVIWALHHLQAMGAVRLSRSYLENLGDLLLRNRERLHSFASRDYASYLMGDTPILMLAHGHQPTEELADRLAAQIAGNLDHPARELMWGSPGTLLAALFLHQRTGEARWTELFRETAAKLWSQLLWSPEHECHHWTQDLYGQCSSYLDGVHGFVATASPLIRGRQLLDAAAWSAWEACIVNTIQRTAVWEGPGANWPAQLQARDAKPLRLLMQFCHGAPGFVICLANLPGAQLDSLLTAAGEAIWAAGPLAKGSNLCHGTGGNGYAFLVLYRRTADSLWLDRARAFAMHGIEQAEAEARRHGRMRYSLWTGDLGFAIYLWDCVHGTAAFPTLDVFYAAPSAA